jgi:hypothetical protein
MDLQLEKEIERLRQSKVKELQERYRELFGEDSLRSNPIAANRATAYSHIASFEPRCNFREAQMAASSPPPNKRRSSTERG